METSELTSANDLHQELHDHFAEVDRLADLRRQLNDQLFAEHPELEERVVTMMVTGRRPWIDQLLEEYQTSQQQEELQAIGQQMRFHASRVTILWYNPQVQVAHAKCQMRKRLSAK